LASLREQLKQAAAGAGGSAGDAARAELGLGDNYYSTSAGQRERMLAATERLQKTSDRLQVGKQQLAETEVSRHVSGGGGGDDGVDWLHCCQECGWAMGFGVALQQLAYMGACG
jgi:hypothetical protein